MNTKGTVLRWQFCYWVLGHSYLQPPSGYRTWKLATISDGVGEWELA